MINWFTCRNETAGNDIRRKKRLAVRMTVVILFQLLFMVFPSDLSRGFIQKADAATFNDINQDVVFLKQKTAGTCTLVSTVMLLRRTAIMMNQDWSAINEDNIRTAAWKEGAGLYHSFTYNGINVAYGTFGADKSAELKSLLSEHPEGIIVHGVNQAGNNHAVLITDDTDDTFYCADSANGTPYGRIPVSSSSINLASIKDYWYVAAPDVNLAADAVTPVITDHGVNVVSDTTVPGIADSTADTVTGSNAPVNPNTAANATADILAPVITNAVVTDVTGNGYTVTCNVTDNIGVTDVKCLTWTKKDDQNDAVWKEGTINGSRASVTIKTDAHNNESGIYITCIYAYDAAGNQSFIPVTVGVPKTDADRSAPVITACKKNSMAVSGIGINGSIVYVKVSGKYYKGIVENNGRWSVAVPRLKAGIKITAFSMNTVGTKSKKTIVTVK